MEQSNSIYEYYRKISGRYWIAREQKSGIRFIWEPMARPVKIQGFKGYDFFIVREGRKQIGELTLCEGLSGAYIIRQKALPSRVERRYTMKEFIVALPDLLEKLGGNAAINQAIVNYIFDNDQETSPRYRVKKL